MSHSLPDILNFYLPKTPWRIFMKKIAFTCSSENDYYFIKHNYIRYLLDGAERCGIEVLPMILPPVCDINCARAYADEFDGFIFPGGGDIFPTEYGAEHIGLSNDFNLPRDKFELMLIPEIVRREKPVLGICRGLQVMAVALGSTLWQDIGVEFNKLSHAVLEGDTPSHKVIFEESGKTIFKKDFTITNSYHHQAVKDLGGGLRADAYSEDGVIEAISSSILPYYRAVQWHPEIAMNEDSEALIDSFLKALN